MAIEFHCQHCGKLIRAGDEHAGKRGKCPHCQNSVYIPTPSDQIETLDLAPVDESDERHQQELLEESRELAHTIMRDKETLPPTAPSTPAAAAPTGDIRLAAAAMESMVIQYAQLMAKGNLSEADEIADEIRTNMSVAEDVIQRITADEIPPAELADIPRPVLNGFFKQLRENA